MKYKTKPHFVDAEQWFKGKTVEGVIEKKFEETGHWSDRFACHSDVYIENDGIKLYVKEGDFILRHPDGDIEVMSPKYFFDLYDPVDLH